MRQKPTTTSNNDNNIKESEDWKEAEVLFRDWLQTKKVPFMRISQLENSEYSDELRSSNTVRPDFFVLIKGIGAIAVDVKFRRTYTTLNEETKKRSGKKFYVNVSERDKLVNFEDNFHMHTWCCFIEKKQGTKISDKFYFCRVKDFCDEGLDRKQLHSGVGILLEKKNMKLIPATPDGSLRELLCD